MRRLGSAEARPRRGKCQPFTCPCWLAPLFLQVPPLGKIGEEGGEGAHHGAFLTCVRRGGREGGAGMRSTQAPVGFRVEETWSRRIFLSRVFLARFLRCEKCRHGLPGINVFFFFGGGGWGANSLVVGGAPRPTVRVSRRRFTRENKKMACLVPGRLENTASALMVCGWNVDVDPALITLSHLPAFRGPHRSDKEADRTTHPRHHSVAVPSTREPAPPLSWSKPRRIPETHRPAVPQRCMPSRKLRFSLGDLGCLEGKEGCPR